MPKRKKTARSYAALRRAAYYPLNLPSDCKGFHRLSSVYTAIMRHLSEIPDTVRLVLCVALPDNLKLFSFDFIGLRATYTTAWSVFGPPN
jgi:hypothetical protein